MNWLKDAYLDVVILLFMVLFALYTNNVLEIILWVYTTLLLLSKALTFFMPSLNRKANKTTAPALFYNIIYGLTVAILLYMGKYYLGGAWIAIWIISVVSFINTNKKKP